MQALSNKLLAITINEIECFAGLNFKSIPMSDVQYMLKNLPEYRAQCCFEKEWGEICRQ